MMKQVQPSGRYEQLVALAQTGTPHAVDTLMRVLVADDGMATSRLIDYALGLVDTREGHERLRHYLFEGTPQQRNYAALYFKRRNVTYYLEEAVSAGAIDAVQAFSR
jgi:HEAT repeat protein